MELNFAKDQDINNAASIAQIPTEHGLSADIILEKAQSEAIKVSLRQQTETARTWGIFGAPTVFVGDEGVTTASTTLFALQSGNLNDRQRRRDSDGTIIWMFAKAEAGACFRVVLLALEARPRGTVRSPGAGRSAGTGDPRDVRPRTEPFGE